jgi:hypothetical protein
VPVFMLVLLLTRLLASRLERFGGFDAAAAAAVAADIPLGLSRAQRHGGSVE